MHLRMNANMFIESLNCNTVFIESSCRDTMFIEFDKFSNTYIIFKSIRCLINLNFQRRNYHSKCWIVSHAMNVIDRLKITMIWHVIFWNVRSWHKNDLERFQENLQPHWKWSEKNRNKSSILQKILKKIL